MRKPMIALAFSALTLLTLGGVSPAWADAAPPANPPGSSISTGKFQTRVQMVSENVLMTIDDYTPAVTQPPGSMQPTPYMRGHVDATFLMQNQGDAAESFDVWFPIGLDTGYEDYSTVDNFRAWVDGVEATKIGQQYTQGVLKERVPWATWPATFPPGKQVTLRVTYDTFPTGFQPYAQFKYILATGAGWHGSIGEGTVTFRLPYDVNDMNAIISGPRIIWQGFSPPDEPFTVQDKDVIWHFTDLEPTTANDITLTVLAPAIWRRIVAAQKTAADNPKSVYDQLALADAAQQAMYLVHDLVVAKIGGTSKLVAMTNDAYESALRLDPNNLRPYIAYLNFLDKNDLSDPDMGARFTRVLNHALEIAPDDPRLAELRTRAVYSTAWPTTDPRYELTKTAAAQHEATQDAPIYAEYTATANARATIAEAIRLGVNPQPIDTPTFTNRESETSTSAPTPPETPMDTATATATPTPISAAPSGNVQEWSAFVLPGVIVVIIAAVWLRRRSRGQS